MFQNVHAPVFFQKLAQDYGVVPENEHEATQLLEMAGKLRYAQQDELSKSAGDRADFLGEANNELSAQLGLPGQATGTDHEFDSAIKQASVEMAKDPVLQEAVLTYQDSIAASLLDQQIHE